MTPLNIIDYTKGYHDTKEKQGSIVCNLHLVFLLFTCYRLKYKLFKPLHTNYNQECEYNYLMPPHILRNNIVAVGTCAPPIQARRIACIVSYIIIYSVGMRPLGYRIIICPTDFYNHPAIQ